MDIVTQLERKISEVVIEALQGAISETLLDEDKALSLRIAQIWVKHQDDEEAIFQAIYFDSLSIRIVGNTDEIIDLDDFPTMADLTQNPFMAPILFYAARKINWENIVERCAELFYDPNLMGQFHSPHDAISKYSGSKY